MLLTPLGSQLLAGAQEEGQKPSCGHGAPWAPRGEKKDAALRNNPFQEHPYLGKVTPCLRTAGERAVTACRSTCPRHGSHPPPHTPIPRSGDSSQTLPHRHLHGLALGHHRRGSPSAQAYGTPPDTSPKYTDTPSKRERGQSSPCFEGFEREGGQQVRVLLILPSEGSLNTVGV